MRWILGILLAAGVLIYPETAANAVREAMRAWYTSVAPALFPFMALMPLLTGKEAASIYRKLMGWFTRPLLGLPGQASPAIAIALLGGSPAGANAVLSLAEDGSIAVSEAKRISLCMTGLSPAFLITGIGLLMLGSESDGRMLAGVQLLVQSIMLFFTRRINFGNHELIASQRQEEKEYITNAVKGVLNVCGYMILFNIAACLIRKVLPWEKMSMILTCTLDLPTGVRFLTRMEMQREHMILCVSAMNGLCGLCIGAQNMAVLKKIGISWKEYIVSRIAAAALSVGICALILNAEIRIPGKKAGKILNGMSVAAVGIAIFPLIFELKNLFLNKRNFPMRE